MPQNLGNGCLRYSADEAREMYARGEIRWISPEESAERLRLAGMPAGAAIRHTVRPVEGPARAWVNPTPEARRAKASAASKRRARERRARLAAEGGGR